MVIRNKKGFTLIELIMVIVIIGVLAAIAIPTFGNLTRNAQEGATRGSLGAIRSAVSIEYARQATTGNAAFPASITTSLFANGAVPVNPITNSSVVLAVVAVPTGAAQATTNGWWYTGTTAGIAGRVGAYVDNTSTSDPTNW